MKHAEKVTPVAAAVSALVTLACCLPVGFAAAASVAAVGAFVAPFRPWLIAASVVLLGVGFAQVRRQQRACTTTGRTPWMSIVMLGAASLVVVLVALFPQVLAGLLADWMP